MLWILILFKAWMYTVIAPIKFSYFHIQKFSFISLLLWKDDQTILSLILIISSIFLIHLNISLLFNFYYYLNFSFLYFYQIFLLMFFFFCLFEYLHLFLKKDHPYNHFLFDLNKWNYKSSYDFLEKVLCFW